jgi:glycosyltransferase involved in cell wall biosynthesis
MAHDYTRLAANAVREDSCAFVGEKIALAVDRLDRRRHHIFAIWLEGLVEHLRPHAPNVSVIRLRRPNRPMDFGDAPAHVVPKVLESHYAYAALGPRWFDRLGLDLVHFPFLYSPYSWSGSRVARVVTIHGSARNEMPYEMRKSFGVGKHARMVRSLEAYDAILAVSESARREASEFYRIPESRIRVVYDAIGEQFHTGEPDASVLERYGVRRPYVLSLCTLRPKKNVATTVAAFAELKKRGLPHRLVLVGDKAPGYTEVDERIAALGLEDDVVQTGFVPAADVPEFYRGADLLVFPSFHEGFGLPVAEAQACGCPVVATNAYAIPEVSGGAAELVDDPRDAEEVAARAYAVLSDDGRRARLVDRGLDNVHRFRWERVTGDLVGAYADALETSRRRQKSEGRRR